MLLGCKSESPITESPVLEIALPDGLLVNLEKESSVTQIRINTNIEDWNASHETTEANSWCEVKTIKSKGMENITLTVTENPGTVVRKTKLIVAGSGVEKQVIEITQLGSDPVITANIIAQKLNKNEQEFAFEIVSNIEYRVSTSSDWIKVLPVATKTMITKGWSANVAANVTFDARKDTILIEQIGENVQNPVFLKIPVEQAGDDLINAFPDDKKIGITNALLTRGNTYGSENVGLTIDESYQTHYSSSSTAKGDSVIIDYSLEPNVSRVDYIKLVQRANGDQNSVFSKGSIWYLSATRSDWKLAGNFDVAAGDLVEMKLGIASPSHIRVCIQSHKGHAVALAEFEAYESADKGDISSDAAYFSDDVFSELKTGVSENDLNKITNPMIKAIARELLNNSYPKEFRSRAYNACEDPSVVGSRLKIGSRSAYDNPMGIYFKQGEKYIIFVGDTHNQSIQMFIRDFRASGGSTTIKLKQGLNVVTSPVSGNGYIRYWSSDYKTLQPVNIHVAFGHEIGFWDQRAGHKNADWNRILAMASDFASSNSVTNAMIDVLGKRIQLINTVDAFAQYVPSDIEELMIWHDSIQSIEYRMMGLYKHNVVPYNRTLNARSWGGAPNWNGQGAWYPNTEREMLVVDALKNSVWLFGHELGHGNQIKPHMHMTGWGETTNNNYNQYVQYLLSDKRNLRLDHERVSRKQGDSENVIGGRFNAYLNEAHVVKEPYLTQEGPDYKKGSMNGTGLRGDHFVKCIPLWQLTIYFMIAGEGTEWHRPDFWADVNWSAIQDNRTNLSNGARYVNFMKRCIDASQLNLASFFEQMGLLRPSDRSIDDYAVGQVTITESDVNEVKAYGASKPMPSSPVISYISLNSADAFKYKRPVEGGFNQGITDNGQTKTISHSIWKNVVVFETYKANELIDVAMVGTGSSDNSTTHVRYPDGATRIEAVSWDGTRTLVKGTR